MLSGRNVGLHDGPGVDHVVDRLLRVVVPTEYPGLPEVKRRVTRSSRESRQYGLDDPDVGHADLRCLWDAA